MPRIFRVLLALLILAVIVGAPLAYHHFHTTTFRNFHVVREGVLYRSGQMSLTGLRRALHDHGIKTIVTLRDTYVPGKPPPDKAEEDFCLSKGYRHVRLSPRSWELGPDGSAVADHNVQTFRELLSDPKNHPVLVHCFAGVHRAGTFCAIYRMEFEGWSAADAIDEMKHYGYLDNHPDVMAYLQHYRPKTKNRPDRSISAIPVFFSPR